MSRKKKTPPESAGSPWITTFADLMNLLLCFFILLFSMSTVDSDKYDQLVKSMSSSFSVYDSSNYAVQGDRVIPPVIPKLPDSQEYTDNGEVDGSGSEDKINKGKEDIFEDELLQKNKQATRGIYDNILQNIEKYDIFDDVNINIDPTYRYVQITLDGHILFDPGVADIKQEAYPLLEKLADILKEFNEGQVIEIEGHTDNVPISRSIYSSNEILSSARAINAATYLIDEKGFNPASLKWTGRGEYNPIAPNTNPDERAKNRRIEIKVHNNINR